MQFVNQKNQYKNIMLLFVLIMEKGYNNNYKIYQIKILSM